jgi:hypothetical protein
MIKKSTKGQFVILKAADLEKKYKSFKKVRYESPVTNKIGEKVKSRGLKKRNRSRWPVAINK